MSKYQAACRLNSLLTLMTSSWIAEAVGKLMMVSFVFLVAASPATSAMHSAANVPELIAAIDAANQNSEPDSIVLAVGATFTLTEVNNTASGPTGLPTIAASGALTIVGNDGVIERSTATETPPFRLLDIAAGASLTLKNLTLQGGMAVGMATEAAGGAIRNGGYLSLENAIVRNNVAQGQINPLLHGVPSHCTAIGAGIYSSGTLLVQDSIFQNNHARGGRGAPGRFSFPGGGAADGSPGAHGFGGGLYISSGTANLANVIMSENAALGGDGGIGRVVPGGDPHGTDGGRGGNGFGAGLYVAGGTVTLYNSTVSGNAAERGEGGQGGAAPGGEPGAPGAGRGGGLYIEADSMLRLDNLTLAQATSNTASTSDPNIFGSFEIVTFANPLPGDFSGDGAVDAADYVVWRNSLGQSGPYLAADGNLNNQIDSGDYDVWKSNFGNVCPGHESGAGEQQSLAVPEANTIALVALGLAVLTTTRITRRAVLAILWTVWCSAANAATPFFMGLGDLPGGSFSSGATSVSADGSVVVGSSAVATVLVPGLPPFSQTLFEAFRWKQASGMVGLGDLPGGPVDSDASGISADGSIVVGSSAVETVSSHGEPPFRTLYCAFRWTQGQGLISLGRLRNSDTTSVANDLSADGSVVVGMSGEHPFREAEHGEAFRWTQSSGMVGLGELPGFSYSHASGVSADGSVIVGQSWSGARVFIGGEAFRWTQASGMVGLGDLPGGSTNSNAYGVSADGAVIVGEAGSASGGEAFRWTQVEGMIGLGDLAGGSFSSSANGVSADGAVIVGHASSASGTEAFIWDAPHGMRSLRDVLVNDLGLGATLTGWTLTSANDISADGQFIVGSGINPSGNPEAWLARIAPQSALLGDFNHDLTVDAADYVVWRKTNGTQAGYDQWRANFGTSLDVGSAAEGGIVGATGSASVSAEHVSATIPEPVSIALAVAGVAGWIACPRRRK